ncbi:MAG: flagellar hook-length control protein FliK [Nitrospirae bacterium]|nr:flagellar hook-length control protein FliK [Nitrospirota bacterium]
MMMTNLPDVNAAQQFNTSTAAAPQGDNQLTDSKFASLVNKEINSHETTISNNEANNALIDLSINVQVNEADNKSEKQGQGPDSKAQADSGLTGKVMIDMLNSAATVAITATELQIDVINKTEDCNVTAAENLSNEQIPGENSLKTDAFLYDLMKSQVSEPAKDPSVAQCKNEVENKGGTFDSESNICSVHVLERSESAGLTYDNEKILAALTQGEKKGAADADVNKLLKQLAEHADKNNAEVNPRKAVNSQGGPADLNAQGGNIGSEDLHNKTLLEVIRRLNNADGSKHNADNSGKTLKAESPPDSVNLLNQSNDLRKAEDLLAALAQGDKKGAADADINKLLKQLAEHADKNNTEVNLQEPANSQGDNQGPEEGGLKMGALLSDLVKATIAASPKGSDVELVAQRSSEAANEDETCGSAKKINHEHVSKAQPLVSGSEKKQTSENISNAGNLLAALTQGDKKEPADSDVNKLLKQLAEHAEKNNTEVNPQKPANSQDGSADLNSQGGRKGSEDFQNKTLFEIIRGLNNADAPKHNTENSVKAFKVELPADSVNLLNQTNVKIEAGKPAEGTMPANAARQAEFDQILDKVIYVVKGNKLGVTLEHDNLGKLDINLSMEKGVVNVQVNTSERVVRDYIENNIQYIVDSLAKDGVSVGGFSVALKDNRNNEQNVFVANNKQGHNDGEVIKREAKISSVSGLVSVFA